MNGLYYAPLLEKGALSTKEVRRLMALCLLALQRPPGDAQLECYYCEILTVSLDRHVVHCCPEFALVRFMVLVEFLYQLHRTRKRVFKAMRSVEMGNVIIECGSDTVARVPTPGTARVLVTYFGIVMGLAETGLQEAFTKKIVLAVVQAAARAPPPLLEVLEAFNKQEAPYDFAAVRAHNGGV